MTGVKQVISMKMRRKVERAEQEKMRKEQKDVRSTETVDLRSWPFPWLP